MTKDELADFLKYSSPKELYIVTWNNVLEILYCPFKVIVLVSVGELEKGQSVWVQEVKITMELKTVYVINDKAYYYYHFDIITKGA